MLTYAGEEFHASVASVESEGRDGSKEEEDNKHFP
jgi:hypothetical protein